MGGRYQSFYPDVAIKNGDARKREKAKKNQRNIRNGTFSSAPKFAVGFFPRRLWLLKNNYSAFPRTFANKVFVYHFGFFNMKEKPSRNTFTSQRFDTPV